MHEMNCIHLSRPDYPAISSLAMVPTFAPGAVEHILPQVVGDGNAIAEDLNGVQLEGEKEWGKGTSLCRYLLFTNLAKKQ
jgi:hypothetical protein